MSAEAGRPVEVWAPPPSGPLEPRREPPTFGVTIAAYEAAATIAEAVDSVLAQTYPAAEIIVCDDGSTDGTAEVLARYGDAVTVIRQENRGVAAARNVAIAAARSEFVVNLDADDLFLPNRLELMAAALTDRPDLEVLTTDATLEVDGRPLRRNFGPDFRYAVDDRRLAIIDRCWVGVDWATRREVMLAYGGYDEAIRTAEDWELAIRLVLGGVRFGLVPEPLVRYRLLPGSLSNQGVALLEGQLQALEKTLANERLDEEERGAAMAAVERFRAELGRTRLRESLLARSPTLRRDALAVIKDGDLRWRSRAKAALTWALPGIARRLVARGGSATSGGLRLPVDQ
ncbi:MAG TPA: glycosyltransferase [Solirubrobacterales bacterium]|nr:glycosyltransferase [Solirubrobacterales bacterium]